MSRRQTVDNGMGQPRSLEGCSLVILGLQCLCKIIFVIINKIDQHAVIGFCRVDIMPWLILRRAFTFDAVRTVITLKMKDLRRRRKIVRVREEPTKMTTRNTVNLLVDTDDGTRIF